jgi:dethiobiotin synthetase
MSRPEQLLVVTGTATGVGKTWVSHRLLADLRARDVRVAARKPVQSFDPAAGSPTDAEVLAASTGQDPDDICPPHRSYPLALAPPMAADVLGRPPLRLGELLAELTWPDGVEVGVVETIGGVRSPATHDADSAELATALQPDAVLLVAPAGLGTINAVRLSAAALVPLSVTVLLNRYDPADDLHRRNREWLADRDGLPVATNVDDFLHGWPP